MLKSILFIILTLTANTLLAQNTSEIVIAGAIVNTWTQAGLRVTEKPFDLGIQGNGFFALQTENGERVFSRYGEASLNPDGFLVHSASNAKILGYCAGELTAIDLSQFAVSSNESEIKSFRVEQNGTITAIYSNGTSSSTCQIALALFQNPLKLNRKKHVLIPTKASGAGYIGVPHDSTRGSLYGSSLEELDEEMYRLNTKSENSDRVAIEMEKAERASLQWSKEKTLFYIYNLQVSRSALEEIESSTMRCEKSIKDLVAMVESKSQQPSDTDFTNAINQALAQNESEVLVILGKERLEKAIRFRAKFNEKVWDNFGTSIKFTAF